MDSIVKSHASHRLGFGWLQAVVDELSLEPVCRVVFVTARREVLFQLPQCRTTVSVLTRSLSEEVAVGKGKTVRGDRRGDEPRAGSSSRMLFPGHVICMIRAKNAILCLMLAAALTPES